MRNEKHLINSSVAQSLSRSVEAPLSARVLAVVHIYYPEIWNQLKSALSNIPFQYDLYVTTVESNKDLESDVHTLNPNARFEIVENRGYDIGSFIHVINKINLDDYDYIIKLHTKRDVDIDSNFKFRALDGTKWRDRLLSFLKTPDQFSKCLDTFATNPKIGMINDISVIVKYNIYGKSDMIGTRTYIDEHGLPSLPFCYIAGTMFIARASIFKSIQHLGLSIKDFPMPNDRHSFQPAHIFERLIGYFVYKDGFIISDPILSESTQSKIQIWYLIHDLVIRRIKRYFYQIWVKDGKIHVTVFRIPLPMKFLTTLFKMHPHC